MVQNPNMSTIVVPYHFYNLASFIEHTFYLTTRCQQPTYHRHHTFFVVLVITTTNNNFAGDKWPDELRRRRGRERESEKSKRKGMERRGRRNCLVYLF